MKFKIKIENKQFKGPGKVGSFMGGGLRTLQQAGSLLCSCKICGMKPEQSTGEEWQYVCACGTASAKASTEKESRALWNKIAYCPNWNR